jgi:hypothetical protein
MMLAIPATLPRGFDDHRCARCFQNGGNSLNQWEVVKSCDYPVHARFGNHEIYEGIKRENWHVGMEIKSLRTGKELTFDGSQFVDKFGKPHSFRRW